jgi:integrase
MANIPAREFTQSHVKDFEGYLQEYRTEKGQPLTSRKSVHETASSLFLFAVDNGIIQETPYKGFKKPKTKQTAYKDALTLRELHLLYTGNTDALSENENKARLIFLFAVCAGGLSASDVLAIAPEQVQRHNGRLWLNKNRQKTGNKMFTPLNSIATEIYEGATREGSNGMAMGMSLYRKSVTSMAKAMGIAKHITSHCSRTTFAGVMDLLGEKDSTAKAMMGHKIDDMLHKHYTQVQEPTKLKAVDKLDDAIRNPEKWEG